MSQITKCVEMFKDCPHYGLFNRLDNLSSGGETMLEHIIKMYVYPSYTNSVKVNFRNNITEIYESFRQGYDHCSCGSCSNGWKTKYRVRQTYLNYGRTSFYSKYFAMALRVFIDQNIDFQMAYDWVTTGVSSLKNSAIKRQMFEYDYRFFIKNAHPDNFCKGVTKKGRHWTCEKTGEVIKIKCCTNNNTTGCGYCKIHNK